MTASLFARRADSNAAALGVSQLIVLTWLLTASALPTSGLPWTVVALLATSTVKGPWPSWHCRSPSAERLRVPSSCTELPPRSTRPNWSRPSQARRRRAQRRVAGCGADTLRSWRCCGSPRQADRNELALGAVVIPALGRSALWEGQHFAAANWPQEFLLAAGPYVLLSLYPLAVGARVKSQRLPYLGAILAAAVFFLAGRHAMVAGKQPV